MDISEEDKALIRQKVEKLRASKFKQQTLPAWRPIPSFRSTMITFTVFGAIFLGLGILLYLMSNQISEVVVERYDDAAECNKEALPNVCSIKFNVTADIAGPVYVYYQLDNFYQNHRRYVKSRSFNQLKGEYLTVDKLTDCDPIKKNSDVKVNMTSVGGAALDNNGPAIPCGLVAKSFFRDSYSLEGPVTTTYPTGHVDISNDNIAWDSDREYKFKNTVNLPDGVARWEDIQWLNMEDEHFIVWMRTAGLPNFRKLWGRIDKGISAGEYTVTIQNKYDVNGFDGNKSFVLSTTNALGGKNYFLAVCYIVVGSLCLLFAIIFFVAFMKKKSDGNHRAN